MVRRGRRPRRRKSTQAERTLYLEHKEAARTLILERLNHFNQYYKLKWKRVAIRDTRSRWGSCSEDKNLNFSYKLLFLPDYLRDYVIIHELCHLQHLHHRQSFWDLVAEQAPEYQRYVAELRVIDKLGGNVAALIRVRDHYQSGATASATLPSDAVPNLQQ